MTAIRAAGLTKVFGGGIRAVSDLSLEVPQGQIFGFLGPNGAGKTTTIRLLNGTLTPTVGSSQVLGLESGEEAVRRHTATLAEGARMYEHMSALANLRFFATMYELPRGEAEERIHTLLERLGLWEKRELKLGGYSTGMKKRLHLARTLLHRPQIVFLDEPTAGLDPEGSLQVTDLVHRLAREHGTTIFLCTHNLPLAERICGGFGFIRQGRLVAAGSREELLAAYGGGRRVQIRTDQGVETLPYERETEIDGLIRRLQRRGRRIIEVRPLRPTLEEIYFRAVGRQSDELG